MKESKEGRGEKKVKERKMEMKVKLKLKRKVFLENGVTYSHSLIIRYYRIVLQQESTVDRRQYHTVGENMLGASIPHPTHPN